MKRAYLIALMVCLNIRSGLGQIWMARTFREMAGKYFGHGPELLAKVAFLYGREYGKWECGKIEQAVLRRQMEDVKEQVGDAMDQLADMLQYAVGEAYAVDLLSQWGGFGRFCREALAVEPLTLNVRSGAHGGNREVGWRLG